jgi:hypothetical protein
MKVVTYQTALRIFSNYQPLLSLLTSADQVVAWHPKATIQLARQAVNDDLRDYVSVGRKLLPSEQSRHRRVLSEVLSECVGIQTTGRLYRLNRLAMKLSGRVVPQQHLDRYGSVKPRLAIQRAMLQCFHDQTILAMLNRSRSLQNV